MGSFSLKQLVAVARSLGIRVVAARLGYSVRGRVYEARWAPSSSGARFAPGSTETRSLWDTIKPMLRGTIGAMLRGLRTPLQEQRVRSLTPSLFADSMGNLPK